MRLIKIETRRRSTSLLHPTWRSVDMMGAAEKNNGIDHVPADTGQNGIVPLDDKGQGGRTNNQSGVRLGRSGAADSETIASSPKAALSLAR